MFYYNLFREKAFRTKKPSQTRTLSVQKCPAFLAFKAQKDCGCSNKNFNTYKIY